MPQINLLNQSSVSKSTDQNQSDLINMYLEEDQSVSDVKGEYKVVAYPTFGLSQFGDTSQANVRAMYEQNNVLYVVAGSKFYSVNSTGTPTELGTLNTSSGFAKIASITGGSDTNNQLVIIDGTNGYHYNIGTTTATFPISDADFPQTAVDITAQDDFFIVQASASMSFYINAISNGLSWAALDFGSKFRKADKLAGVVSFKGELWTLGARTTEVWVDTGNADFTFERRADVFIETGCVTNKAVVIAADTLFYLSQSKSGGYGFVAIESYKPKVISTKSIMYQLSQLTTITDCIGYSYAKDGHEFIDWTFATDNLTLTYDISSGVWIKRQSYISAIYGRFLGSCAVACYDKSFIGDSTSGKIYTQSSSVFTENGTAIRRRWVSPPLYKDGKRIFLGKLQIDCQTNVGSSKTFLLEISTDRGITWSTVDTYTVPTAGDGSIYTGPLGSAFCFLFRITTTDNFNFTLLGFSADFRLGLN